MIIIVLSCKYINRLNVSILTVLISFLGVGKVLSQEGFGRPVVYSSNSATVLGQVSIDGEAASEGDVVAIYVGDELRCKLTVIINEGVAWLPNAIVNAKGGEETITFKVYDASAGVVVDKIGSTAVIEPGKSLGSYTEPFLVQADTQAPVITLNGQKSVRINIGKEYQDTGVTAYDNVDGDIGKLIEIRGVVDTSKQGIYTITYNVKDRAGNAGAAVVRTVEVLDITVQ